MGVYKTSHGTFTSKIIYHSSYKLRTMPTIEMVIFICILLKGGESQSHSKVFI